MRKETGEKLAYEDEDLFTFDCEVNGKKTTADSKNFKRDVIPEKKLTEDKHSMFVNKVDGKSIRKSKNTKDELIQEELDEDEDLFTFGSERTTTIDKNHKTKPKPSDKVMNEDEDLFTFESECEVPKPANNDALFDFEGKIFIYVNHLPLKTKIKIRVPTHLEKPGNTWKPDKTWKKLLFL